MRLKYPCERVTRPIFMRVSYEDKTARFIKPRCKMWDCAGCSEIRANAVAHRIQIGLEEHDELDWKFITITSHEKVNSFERGLEIWRDASKRVLEHMRRKGGMTRYAYSGESQPKRGAFHIHMVADIRLSKPALKSVCRTNGLGYQCHIVSVGNVVRTARYMAKYLRKSINDTQWPKRARRANFSRNWPTLPEYSDKAHQYTYIGDYERFKFERDRWKAAGYAIVAADDIYNEVLYGSGDN